VYKGEIEYIGDAVRSVPFVPAALLAVFFFVCDGMFLMVLLFLGWCGFAIFLMVLLLEVMDWNGRGILSGSSKREWKATVDGV